MSIYLVNNEITITWVLEPTDTPLSAGDYDIEYTPSDLEASYTDGAIINYVAPTEFSAGSIQYAFTPTIPGRHKVNLTYGVGTAFLVLDEKNFWVFLSAPTTASSDDVIGALSYPAIDPP